MSMVRLFNLFVTRRKPTGYLALKGTWDSAYAKAKNALASYNLTQKVALATGKYEYSGSVIHLLNGLQVLDGKWDRASVTSPL
jgi:hypothetical protein